MQLNQPTSIRGAVATLTAALLSSGAAAATPPLDKVESSILLYSETNRVTALEGVVSADKTFAGDQKLRMKLTFDGLTGASPNGATPSAGIQTFTRPSGHGSYSVNPGELPLDDTFQDTRVALNAAFSQPLSRLTILSTGVNFSTEYDYLSLGANAGISQEMNGRNTTLSFSAAFSHDQISPEGGIPDPLTLLSAVSGGAEDDDEHEDDDDRGRLSDSDTKDVIDLVAGVSQIIDRKTIARFNYSFSRVSGYQTDPFKIISIVSGPSTANAGEPLDYLYESRPDSRTKNAVFGEVRRYFGGHTVDLSYRYFWDDWGIRSHTVDFAYRLPLGSDKALLPRVRWYHQTQADFYHAFLVDGQSVPQHVSADYRLAKFDAVTVGLAYAFPIAEHSHLKIGAEYYSQFGDKSPPEAFGSLRQYDLFPKLDALMIRLGYVHNF